MTEIDVVTLTQGERLRAYRVTHQLKPIRLIESIGVPTAWEVVPFSRGVTRNGIDYYDCTARQFKSAVAHLVTDANYFAPVQ